MPYPKTEAARLAEAHGITYACAKYRLANGIPLDAPVMPNNNPNGARAWDDQGRTMADIERATGLSRNGIKYRLERGIPLDAPKVTRDEAICAATKKRLEMTAAGTLKKRKYRTDPTRIEKPLRLQINAGRAANPFALLAGKRAPTKTAMKANISRQTAPTTSAPSASTTNGSTNAGVSIPARTYARGGI